MEAFADQIIAVIGRVRVRGAKIVIRLVHVRSPISGVGAVGSDRAVLQPGLSAESWYSKADVDAMRSRAEHGWCPGNSP
jgi:hypothetical protein